MSIEYVPRSAVVLKQNWGVRFTCAVGSLMISRRGGMLVGGVGVAGASEDGLWRLDQKNCATLPVFEKLAAVYSVVGRK